MIILVSCRFIIHMFIQHDYQYYSCSNQKLKSLVIAEWVHPKHDAYSCSNQNSIVGEWVHLVIISNIYMILPMGMGSFRKSSKSQVEIFNKIWWNLYFSAIKNFRKICENSCSWPRLLCKLAQNPLNVVSSCRTFNFLSIWYPTHGEMRFHSNNILNIPQYYFYIAAILKNGCNFFPAEYRQGSPPRSCAGRSPEHVDNPTRVYNRPMSGESGLPPR